MLFTLLHYAVPLCVSEAELQISLRFIRLTNGSDFLVGSQNILRIK
jgi:hypothetical protein